MVVSNRDVIGRGLELLAADLGPFVDAYDRGRPQWAGLDQCLDAATGPVTAPGTAARCRMPSSSSAS
jgi:hypothetical protein